MNKDAKVAHFDHQKSGCMWYRTKHVMDLFERNGISTEKIYINNDVTSYDSIRSFQLYGVYPFSIERVASYLKKDEKRIVYDMDDALDLIDTSNPFYYAVKKDANSAQPILSLADRITVSTPKMAEYAKARSNAPVTIIPNCYDPKEWQFLRPKREGFRIGFAGSATHVQDLIEIIPVIKRLQSESDVRFLIMGFGKQNYETWLRDFKHIAPMEAIRDLGILSKLLETISYEWIPYVDFDIYPQVLTNMSLDIGLCPLKDTPFNQHRSACKAMEYTLSGALALASPVGAYRDEGCCVLVNDGEWESTIIKYMNTYLRNRTNGLHLQWLEKNRHIDTQLETLKEVYNVS